MKKILLAAAVLLLVLLAAAAAIVVPAFVGNARAVDGALLGGGAVQVVDGYVSLFLLPAGEGQAALVDCGNDPAGAAALSALKKRGLPPEAVKAIFLTHGHPDHVAGCHVFPGAEVYAFPGDVALAAGEGRARGPLTSSMRMPKEKAIKVTRTLADGQLVQVGALAVKAYAVPGHTAGSGAFLSAGVLYLGDAANGRADGTVRAMPWVFSDSVEQELASLQKLHARLRAEGAAVETLAFAHSGPIAGLDALRTAAR